MLDISLLRKDLDSVVARLLTRKNPQVFLDVDAFKALEAEREVTLALIRYKSPLAAVTFPRFVNATTDMQAAATLLMKRHGCPILVTGGGFDEADGEGGDDIMVFSDGEDHFGGGGESDGIQLGAPGVVVGPGNVFDGIVQGSRVEFLFRLLRMYRVLTGTSEIQRNTIAKELLQPSSR